MTCARTSLVFSSAARDCSLASLRATSTTSWPCSAKMRASSRPMPLDAPVINAVIFYSRGALFSRARGPTPTRRAQGCPHSPTRSGRSPRVHLEQDVTAPRLALACIQNRTSKIPRMALDAGLAALLVRATARVSAVILAGDLLGAARRVGGAAERDALPATELRRLALAAFVAFIVSPPSHFFLVRLLSIPPGRPNTH